MLTNYYNYVFANRDGYHFLVNLTFTDLQSFYLYRAK